MDKSTLSNYGWIVIACLVLCVMIALASPFGHFIEGGVKSTVQGLFDVNQEAGAIAGLDIPDQTIAEPNTGSNNQVLNAGLYDSNNQLIKSWEKLIDDGDITVDGTTITSGNVDGKLVILYGITAIGEDAFLNNSLLTEVIIPDSVTSLGNSAFSSAISLKNITISKNIEKFPLNAFYMTSLENVVIPEGITMIGEQAFADSSCLASVDIPMSVTMIDAWAFGCCYELTDINYAGTQTDWNAIEKGENWNFGLDNCTIHCTDGDISASH